MLRSYFWEHLYSREYTTISNIRVLIVYSLQHTFSQMRIPILEFLFLYLIAMGGHVVVMVFYNSRFLLSIFHLIDFFYQWSVFSDHRNSSCTANFSPMSGFYINFHLRASPCPYGSTIPSSTSYNLRTFHSLYWKVVHLLFASSHHLLFFRDHTKHGIT
jgi:hypothetical protein